MESPAFYQKELLQLATVGTVQGVDKMGLLLATSQSQVCCGKVKWLPCLEGQLPLSCHCTDYYSNYENSLAAWKSGS